MARVQEGTDHVLFYRKSKRKLVEKDLSVNIFNGLPTNIRSETYFVNFKREIDNLSFVQSSFVEILAFNFTSVFILF